MYVLLALALLSSFTVATQGNFLCYDDSSKKLLMANTVKKDISPLLTGKVFIDVWAREGTVNAHKCTITKFTTGSDGSTLKITGRTTETEGTTFDMEETWKEQKGKGTFEMSGEILGEDLEAYTDNLFVFYVDEYVLGYYSCDEGEYAGSWGVVIAIVKDKKDDPVAQQSLSSAEKEMQKLNPVIPEGVKRFSQSDCSVLEQ